MAVPKKSVKKLWLGKSRLRICEGKTLDPKRFNKLGKGAEGIAYFDKKTGKVVKFYTEFYDSKRPIKSYIQSVGEKPLLRFYYHKIADLLFPGQVLKYNAGIKTVDGYVGMLISDKVDISKEHKLIYDSNSLSTKKQTQDYLNKINSREYNLFIEQLEGYGFIPDTYRSNRDIVNGKPFIFEISDLSRSTLIHFLPKIEEQYGLRTRRQIETYIKRILEIMTVEDAKFKELLKGRKYTDIMLGYE